LAELGFIVVQVDGLGTARRSRAFHLHSYRNLGDGGIDDHIAALRELAERHPAMDLTRVGIYGHSAGGYDAAHAMLTHAEFYKVGVSSAGNHDHRMDKAVWNTQWMGWPVGDHYREQSNVTLAHQLEGKLLLVHGDVDENVPVSATLQFANALIEANKDFDLLILPNQFHSLGRHAYFLRRRWDYFVRHLHDITPPAGYEIWAEAN
jgi:dipeptidyl aminopeptidase/acylaminoacyl peptidase